MIKRRREAAGQSTDIDAQNPGYAPYKKTGWQKQGTQMVGGASSEMSAGDAKAFFDHICGGRKYEGPKWWIPGEVPGIKFYDGKD